MRNREPGPSEPEKAAHVCCPTRTPPSRTPSRARRLGLWSSAVAALTAILSSACCWLPLLLIVFGASAAGVSGFFEAYRSSLLGATGLLLGAGFYLVYLRKEKSEPGEACASPSPRLHRFNEILLWIAAAVVLTFALFPSYAGALLGGNGDQELANASSTAEVRVFRIEGMTCEACAVTLRAHLSGLAGIAAVKVSFASRTATLAFDSAGEPPSDAAILQAISEAGYSGTSVPEGPEAEIPTLERNAGGSGRKEEEGARK